MPNSESPIGVFDSGVGGLPILQAIQTLLPHEHKVYLADTAYAPYGDKSAQAVQQRVLSIGQWFCAMPVKALVVACNTATVLAVDTLRAHSTVPVIGVEPAIKPAALASKTGVVGVLATARTAASASVAKLVDAHGQHVQVLVQACPGLVDAIESDAAPAHIAALLNGWLQPMLDQGADHIVLGCTHYIVLRGLIQQLVGPAVTLVQPSEAVARQLMRQLALVGQLSGNAGAGQVAFYTSAREVHAAASLMGRVWGGEVGVLKCEALK
ncbi:glutamate racemase [Comamonadaceae bacterium M7527]|nr:glutamate racemase [Comamonadaceae bacterium M7527]